MKAIFVFKNGFFVYFQSMKKRIFLLPGFGEDAFSFDEIRPFLKDFDVIDVDYRKSLRKFIFPFINVKNFAKQLIKDNHINADDKLIGHSMGGYFSFQIREIQDNPICMIASFNDPAKIFHTFPDYPRITQLAALTGFVKTTYLKKMLLDKIKDTKIREIQSAVMDNFDTFSNIELSLMAEMNYAPKIKSIKPNPLRLHSSKDRVVMPPDESFVEIDGGHFCQNLYPKETIDAMKDFLLK